MTNGDAEERARALASAARQGDDDALLVIHDEKLWRSLGYSAWNEYVHYELEMGQSTAQWHVKRARERASQV